MAIYTQILYHIIFSTQNNDNVLVEKKLEKLFQYIWEILKDKNCHLYRINAYKNHVHILMSLHPSIALDNLLKEIKINTTKWIRDEKIFPVFTGWENGYGAFTCSIDQKEKIVSYIKNQQEQHKHKSFKDELIEFLNKYKIKFNDRLLD